MRWWLDIEEPDGTKAGPGPLRSATSFEVTRRLDAAGKFKAKASLSDARSSMVQAKRRVRAWGRVDDAVTDLGAGIIDKIGVDIDLNLELSGDDLLRELTYHQVGSLQIGASGSPVTTGPALIAALFPTGWSLDVVNGYNATLKTVYHVFEGESCLAALCKLAEITGEHFRLGAGRTVVWMQKDQADSGIRAVQGGEPVSLEANPDVCVVTDLQEDQDSYDGLAGRVYAYGVGDGDARITLSGTTIGVTGWTVGNDSKGYYLQHTATWNAYGIERYMSFKDISDSTTLLETAYEWMVNRLALPRAYKISVAKLDQVISVGSSIRVIYKRVIDGVAVLDIDTDLIVLETTTKLDADGLHTTALKVATVAVWPDNAGSAVSSGMSTSRDFYTHPQGFSGSTDVWSAIASAFGKIILLPAGGGNCTFYDPNESGVDDAIAAAVSYDGIYGPFPVEIAMTHGITIPASVRVRDLNLAFDCGGVAVTFRDYVELNHCRIVNDGTGTSYAWAVDGRDVRDVKIVNTYAIAMNASQNIGALLRGVAEDHGPEVKGSWMQAFNGNNCISLLLYADAFVESSYVGGTGGDITNIGVEFDSALSGKRAGQFINSWSTVTGTGAWAGTLVNSHYGRAVGSHFMGETLGLFVPAGCTLDLGCCTWNSLSYAGTINYLYSDRSPINHTHAGLSPHFNVRDYGATGNGTTDDTAAFNAARAALIAAGKGVFYMPAGRYLTSGGFNFSVPTLFKGNGSASYFDDNVAATVVICNSATNSLFEITSVGCDFQDFYALCTAATPTAGAGITVSSNGDHIRYDNLTIRGFYKDIDIQDGAMWNMHGCYLLEPVKYGLHIQHADFSGDFGDWAISNTEIMSGSRDADAAIYIQSGGGGKISNLKINGWYASPPTGHAFLYGIYLGLNNITTSIFLLSNSSIENVVHDGFAVLTAGTGSYDYIIINGCQFGMYGSDSSAINIEGAGSGDINSVIINGVTLSNNGTSSDPAIQLTNCENVTIGAIINRGFPSTISLTGCTNVFQMADHNHSGAADGGKLTNDYHDGYADWDEISAPSAPASNVGRVYCRDDGGVTKFFYKRSDNVEVELGTSTFLGLTDTPSSYSSQALKVPRVNTGETALEFYSPAAFSQVFPVTAFVWIGIFKKVAGSWTAMAFQNVAGRAFAAGWYQDTPADADAAETVVILDSGTYDVYVTGMTGNNEGKLDWKCDGTNFITGQDWYSSGLTEAVTKTGTLTIASGGTHTIRMVVNGKNASSSDYYWLLTSISFVKQ